MDMATAARARIDKEITKHMLSIYELRSERNSWSPIFRLPSELLLAIFSHCIRDQFLHEWLPHRVNFLHVCRHWRGIAFDTPAIWTHISMTAPPDWTDVSLARSEQSPLKINATPRSSGSASISEIAYRMTFVNKVAKHVERIQDIIISLSGLTYPNCLLFKLSSRAPVLQYLEVSMGCGTEEMPLPFHGDTPSLLTLRLESCALPWYSFNLSNLTTLSLRRTPEHCRQGVAGFLPILSRMQGLRNMYLVDALNSSGEFITGESLQKTQLPCLSRFLIIAPLSTIVTLLCCVEIPLQTELRLNCRNDNEPIDPLDNYTLLCSLVSQRIRTLEDQALPDLIIRSMVTKVVDEHSSFIFSTLRRTPGASVTVREYTDPEFRGWGCHIPLEVNVRMDQSEAWSGGSERFRNEIFRFLPCENIESLHVIKPPSSPAAWKMMLGYLRGLRHLKLSNGMMPDLTSVLSPGGAKNKNGNAPGNQCRDANVTPVLEELELEDIGLLSDSVRNSPQDDSMNRLALYDMLSGRNMPDGRLVMSRCYLNGRNVEFKLPDSVLLWGQVIKTPLPAAVRSGLLLV